MEVLGRDSRREAIRIASGGTVALLPECLISQTMTAARPLTGGRGHQTAYDWIARHAAAIDTAIKTLRTGGRPRPPFDRMELLEEETRCPPKS